MNRVRDLLYLLFGYLSGCVLYAEVFSRVFHKEIASAAKDKNPGAANAFVHGGFWCGRWRAICSKAWFPWRCICTICPMRC